MNVMPFILIVAMTLSGNAIAAEVSCRTAACHARVGGTENFHVPVKENDCQACHKQTNSVHPLKNGRSFNLTAENEALCYQCHNRFGSKQVVHPPVKEGACTNCHRPHGGEGRFLLGVGSNQTGLCYSCHDPGEFTQKFQHGPIAVGTCTQCHNPHEEDRRALLRSSVWEMCVKCHVDLFKPLSEASFIHKPVKDGPCTVCHSPHSSPNAKLLRQEVPNLCLGCHKKMEKSLQAKLVHKPLTQEGGCTTCHSVHFSRKAKLLASDGVELCLRCHGRDDLGKPPLKNIKKEIAGKKVLHGPIAKGQCQACHDPHGNDNYRLLRGNYPTGLYVPYTEKSYELCLSCHEKNLLRFKETTLYTGFRNGKRNLHYVHVVNDKGRTCRICHEPHASDSQKLMRAKGYQFGEWNIPINIAFTATGGSCAPGCHRPFSYDREKAVVYKNSITGSN